MISSGSSTPRPHIIIIISEDLTRPVRLHLHIYADITTTPSRSRPCLPLRCLRRTTPKLGLMAFCLEARVRFPATGPCSAIISARECVHKGVPLSSYIVVSASVPGVGRRGAYVAWVRPTGSPPIRYGGIRVPSHSATHARVLTTCRTVYIVLHIETWWSSKIKKKACTKTSSLICLFMDYKNTS